jgi:hypothetical protein
MINILNCRNEKINGSFSAACAMGKGKMAVMVKQIYFQVEIFRTLL